MLRLKLERFEEKPDERGYMREEQVSEILTVVVADYSEADKLIEMVKVTLRPILGIAQR